jgi:hypothetical protein
MSEAGIVLETSAVLGYADGVITVGARIRKAADEARSVVVPALCLAEAYRQTDGDGWHLLDVLATHPHVVVAPVERDMCGVLGGWTRTLQAMDVAQAIIEAASRPIVPIMTDKRALVTQFLPAEWPIVEL